MLLERLLNARGRRQGGRYSAIADIGATNYQIISPYRPVGSSRGVERPSGVTSEAA